MRSTIKAAILCSSLLALAGGCTSCVELDENQKFISLIYDGNVVRRIRAFNPERGGKTLFIFGGSGKWFPSGCYVPFWDSPGVIARGEITIQPEEIEPLLFEMRRVSQECNFPRQIFIGCWGSQWNDVFFIGPRGKYIRGLRQFEKWQLEPESRGESRGVSGGSGGAPGGASGSSLNCTKINP